MSPNQILQGVRILAFTTGYAGPYAGRLLASYGAEVIKIESKKGGLDTFRHYGQHKDIDEAPRFIECNLGVRSLAITCGAVWCNHQAVLDAHVERGGGSMSALPGKWTFAVQQPMSAKGQKRTFDAL